MVPRKRGKQKSSRREREGGGGKCGEVMRGARGRSSDGSMRVVIL